MSQVWEEERQASLRDLISVLHEKGRHRQKLQPLQTAKVVLKTTADSTKIQRMRRACLLGRHTTLTIKKLMTYTKVSKSRWMNGGVLDERDANEKKQNGYERNVHLYKSYSLI